MHKNNLDLFFNPKFVALVGATEKRESLSCCILKNLIHMGYKGTIYPVNPKYKSVFNLPCYPSLLELPQQVELVIIAVPAKYVHNILEQQGKLGLKNAVIITAGFEEIGNEGLKLAENLKEIMLKYKLRILGPNCLGTLDNHSSFTTSFIPWGRVCRPKRGGVTILSQSGSVAHTLLDLASQEGIGIARIANYGNRMDIGESDLLSYFAEDENTKVVAIYMESVDNGKSFVQAAAKCSKAKPIVSIKVGKGKAGEIAAKSHTGAIAGRYEIYKAAFRKAGILEAFTLEAFIDGAKALSMQKAPKGNRILIITNGGGFGVMAADGCNERDLEVPLPSTELKNRLRIKYSGFYVISNPIDLTGNASDENYKSAINEFFVNSDEYDAAIIIPLMALQFMTENIVDIVSQCSNASGKPAVICTIGGAFSVKIKQMFEDKNLPVYPSPERAVRAMKFLVDRATFEKELNCL